MSSSPRVRTTFAHLVAGVALLVSPAVLAQSAAPTVKDSGTMARADKEDMSLVLKKLQELGAKPVEQLTVEQARKQPSAADAVKAVLKDKGQDPVALMAAMGVGKKDPSYPTGGGSQMVRIYAPEGASAPRPVIVYYHGGGWVIADVGTYEASAMALAKKVDAIVASVEYRHAPEHKFPAAHEDAFEAYKWVLANAASFGGDPARVAVAGESAGGNLAATTAIMARDQNVQAPRTCSSSTQWPGRTSARRPTSRTRTRCPSRKEVSSGSWTSSLRSRRTRSRPS